MNPPTEYTCITPIEVHRKIEAHDKVLLVDVRTPPEYALSHIAGVVLMPLDQFGELSSSLPVEAEIICICEHGVRSEAAARYLASRGFLRAATMTGGMAEYAGPTESGRP